MSFIAMSSVEGDINSHVDGDNQDNDVERTAIRAKLSNLSFEELQKLKERMGAKVYNEAIFGNKTEKQPRDQRQFKRENKNRPREMSSKQPVPMLRNEIAPSVKKKEARDPRFDPLCGEFEKKEFEENYKFLSELRLNDIKSVSNKLKKTANPEEKLKLKRLLQRLKDQCRASRTKQLHNEMKKKQKEIIQKALSEGVQHRFMNKSEQRVESLVHQYEQLKTEGPARIQRHLKRRQQKINKRSHRAPVEGER